MSRSFGGGRMIWNGSISRIRPTPAATEHLLLGTWPQRLTDAMGVTNPR